jgi:hypothetical protein
VALETVRFVGGPCNGKTNLVGTAAVFSGVVLCGGATYTVQTGTSGPVLAQYRATVVTTGGRTAQAINGYRDLLQATRSNLPNSLASASKITTAAMRRSSRQRKVG